MLTLFCVARTDIQKKIKSNLFYSVKPPALKRLKCSGAFEMFDAPFSFLLTFFLKFNQNVFFFLVRD